MITHMSIYRIQKKQLDISISCIKESILCIDDTQNITLSIENTEKSALFAHMIVQFTSALLDDNSFISHDTNDLQKGILSIPLGQLDAGVITNHQFKIKAIRKDHRRQFQATIHFSPLSFDINTVKDDLNVSQKEFSVNIDVKTQWNSEITVIPIDGSSQYLSIKLVCQGLLCSMKRIDVNKPLKSEHLIINPVVIPNDKPISK